MPSVPLNGTLYQVLNIHRPPELRPVLRFRFVARQAPDSVAHMSRLRALVIPSPTCRAYVPWRRGRGAAPPLSRAPAARPRRRRRAPRAFPGAGRPDTCLPATAQAARQAPNTIGVSYPGMSAGPDRIEYKIKKDHLAERQVVHGRGKAASPKWHRDP